LPVLFLQHSQEKMCSGPRPARQARPGSQTEHPANSRGSHCSRSQEQQTRLACPSSADLSLSTCRLRTASAPLPAYRDEAERRGCDPRVSSSSCRQRMHPPPAPNSPRLWCCVEHHPTLWVPGVRYAPAAGFDQPTNFPAAAPRDRPPPATCRGITVKPVTLSSVKGRRRIWQLDKIASSLQPRCHEQQGRHRAVAGSF